jgi:hypothetical protein
MVELNITFETLDCVGGLSPRYAQKLLGSTPTKRLGEVSLGCVLGALGLRLIVVEDPEQLARVKDRLTPREIALPVRAEMAPIAPQMAAGDSSVAAGVYQPS